MPAVLTTWVYFDAQSGTPVIQDDENVASITDGGVGTFTVNFTTNYVDTNFVASQCSGGVGSSAGETISTSSKAVGSMGIVTGTDHAFYDLPFNHIMILGTLV
jgi:hypothetical protein